MDQRIEQDLGGFVAHVRDKRETRDAIVFKVWHGVCGDEPGAGLQWVVRCEGENAEGRGATFGDAVRALVERARADARQRADEIEAKAAVLRSFAG